MITLFPPHYHTTMTNRLIKHRKPTVRFISSKQYYLEENSLQIKGEENRCVVFNERTAKRGQAKPTWSMDLFLLPKQGGLWVCGRRKYQ